MKKDAKDQNQMAEGVMELDVEDLEQVTGGANPFAKYARVPNQDYDSDIRDKA